MITALDITDEQIRELAASADVSNYCGPDDYLGMQELQRLCMDGLATEARYNGQRAPAEHVAYPTITIIYVNPRARARCAEILNARKDLP